jgi:hypothetical protein
LYLDAARFGFFFGAQRPQCEKKDAEPPRINQKAGSSAGLGSERFSTFKGSAQTYSARSARLPGPVIFGFRLLIRAQGQNGLLSLRLLLMPAGSAEAVRARAWGSAREELRGG